MNGKQEKPHNPVLLSSGCFTGRINGRNPYLLCRCFDKLGCDGFELMLFEEFDARRREILREYTGLRIPVRVIHADKRTGDFLGSPEPGSFEMARDIFLSGIDTAVALGAGTMVFHPWGLPDSTAHTELIFERISLLLEESRASGVCAVPENCVCRYGTPLMQLSRLMELLPELTVTVDTRAAAFHAELDKTLETLLPLHAVRHMHILDYSGAPGDWDARRNIPQPGDGGIDWKSFFAAVRNSGYSGALTMEAPSMLADGVDTAVFERSLDFIRRGLRGS